MNLQKWGDQFVWVGGFTTKDLPKEAGFRWDRERKIWWTKDATKAVLLRPHADPQVQATIDEQVQLHRRSLQQSQATDAEIEVPAPEGLDYLPYQRAGIAYAMHRDGTLIADEMGLGKTIQALGVVNADPSIERVLIVCPASLKLNWRREARRWLVRQPSIAVADSKGWPRWADVVIVNYDILEQLLFHLYAETWDLLIFDECHYMKNTKAKRTALALGGIYKEEKYPGIKAGRRLMLTGTPIVNRPVELWPIVHALDPEEFPRFFSYAKRYCGAHHNGFAWDFKGATNLAELQRKLRSRIMVRRLKKDVLKELPPKRRQVIEMPTTRTSNAAIKAEFTASKRHESSITALRAAVELAKASDDDAVYRAAVQKLREGVKVQFDEIADLRHKTAIAKVPQVIDHITTVLEEEQKLVVFAHHHDVIAQIRAPFRQQAVVVTGETPLKQRQVAVDAFQQNPHIRLFIGNLQAAGVGLTLTAASHVVFAELDWVPGVMSQAEDRCHRYGQQDAVLVQHLVLEGSLDSNMAHELITKQAVIDAALDVELSEDALEPITTEASATKTTTRKIIDAEADQITADQITAIHEGLRTLAAMDNDRAHVRNGVGFSKVDGVIGHSLAGAASLTSRQAVLGRRIIRKYHKQLGAAVLEAAGVA